jgi:uncharacterized protein with GYD domain
MAHFITYASYSPSGIQGLISKPSDRAKALEPLLAKVGAKIVGLYMTTGSNDIVMITTADDGSDVAAVSMAVGASGALARIETVRAWDSSEFVAVAKKAGGLTGAYTPPGA